MSKDPDNELGCIVWFLVLVGLVTLWFAIGFVRWEAATSACRMGYATADSAKADTVVFWVGEWPAADSLACAEIMAPDTGQ